MCEFPVISHHIWSPEQTRGEKITAKAHTKLSFSAQFVRKSMQGSYKMHKKGIHSYSATMSNVVSDINFGCLGQ